MTSVYMLCKALISRGRIDGLMAKMDAYMANDRLTANEYSELAAMLPKTETPETEISE